MTRLTKTYLVIGICLIWTSSVIAQKKATEEMKELSRNTNMLSQMVMLNYDKNLVGDLEILDPQLAQVKDIGQMYRDLMTDFAEGVKELRERANSGDAEAKRVMENFDQRHRESLGKIQRLTIGQLEKVLLPHQMKRLTQISQQVSFKWMKGTDYFGMPYALADQLELSPTQKKKLKIFTDKTRKEFYQEIAKIREKKMKNILGELTPEQRKKFENIVGDFYDTDRAFRNQMKVQNRLFKK